MGFKNFNKFQKRLAKRLQANPVENSKRAVTRGTLVVRTHAVQSILKGGTGRIYEKYQPRRTHQASVAGEPPASDTGFLASQVTSNVKTMPDGAVIGQIVSAAPYSKHLEFGTTQMMARPFMQPALNLNRRRITKIFKDEGVIT